jgi:hypothetical protein
MVLLVAMLWLAASLDAHRRGGSRLPASREEEEMLFGRDCCPVRTDDDRAGAVNGRVGAGFPQRSQGPLIPVK